MSSLTGVSSMKNACIATYKMRRSYHTETSMGPDKGRSTGKSKKKKSPRYSFKQVSSQILRAKNSNGAAQAYQAARRKVAELRRLSGNNSYDQEEVEIAIRHAEAILRVARKKRNHLADEERSEHERKSRESRDELTERVEESLREDAAEESFTMDGAGALTEELTEDMGYDPFSGLTQEGDAPTSGLGEFSEEGGEELAEAELSESCEELSEELSEELTADLEEMMQELEDEMAMEEQMEALSDFLSPHASEEDLEELKKKHRAKELMEITRADMKYLKAMFEKYQRERSEASSGGGYSSEGKSESGGLPRMHFSVSVSSVSADTTPAEGGTIDVSA